MKVKGTVLLVVASAAMVLVGSTSGATGDASLPGGTLVASGDGAVGDLDLSRVVIGFRDGIPARTPAYVNAAGGEIVMQEPVLGFVVVAVEPEHSANLLEAAQADPQVLYAEHDSYVRALQFFPNDTLWSLQFSPHNAINLPEAWEITLGSHDANIHILDTGIDHTHADLLPNLSPLCNGPTFLGRSEIGVGKPSGQESGFHGTHVAGIAGAVTHNGLGVAGASQSCLTSVQVLAADSGLSSWVAAGIRWSADNGADVISMSLGGPASGVLGSAVRYADSKGVLQVAAAGNDGCASGSGNVGFPAAYGEVVAVAALTNSGTGRASFSSCGPQVEISAPGSSIWSTLPGNTYGPLDGTSMATPFVSGVAGLVWSANATLTHTEVRCILTATARDMNPTGHDTRFGWGRLDAEAAVTVALDPVEAAKDPSVLDTSRGVCPEGIFEEEVIGPVFDPGHAYVDVASDGVFDADLDTPIASGVIHNGTYVVENTTHGLVIPPSVGLVATGNVTFRSGSEGHLVVRVDIHAGQIELHGGSVLDTEGIHATAAGRLDLISSGSLQAVGATILANTMHVEAPGSIHLDGAALTSSQDRVFVAGKDIHAPGATVQGHSAVRFKALGDLDIAGTTLSATDGNVRLDAGGTVSL